VSALRGDRLTAIAALLCVAGLAVAGYLTYVHYEEIAPVCTTGGCEKVQSSSYAELAGVPVALLGVIGYALIGLSLLWRGDLGHAATAALTLAGFGFSAYLTYLELFEIDAICQWCVASAVLMTALLVVAVIRLLRPAEVPAPDPPAADRPA
jgi:uncharacterized membrane protein